MNNDCLSLIRDLKSDHLLYGHCFRVSKMAMNIAKKLNFSEKDIVIIGIGGLLHDIGKLNIPKEILYKESKLTDKEFEEIKKHPIYGYNALSIINISQQEVAVTEEDFKVNCEYIYPEILDMVLYHHRHYNGSGYPKVGIDRHPEMTQIITICDCFDAMCDQTRTYKKALSIDEAIIELKNNSGTQFKPLYVDTLISILKD